MDNLIIVAICCVACCGVWGATCVSPRSGPESALTGTSDAAHDIAATRRNPTEGGATAGRRESRPTVPPGRKLEILLAAIRHVESGGDDRAVGDGGASRGAYQITADYWHDGCEFGGVPWDYHRMVRSRPHCEQVMQWYWQRYGATTDEQRARMHNGGPRGHHKQVTLAYWGRVKKAMAADGQ